LRNRDLIEKFPEGISLQVFVRDRLYFQSSGKWLYPLFDLEEEIKVRPIALSKAIVRDKVIGKAAALFLIHLGAWHVHGELMSELAVKVFKSNHIHYSFGSCVPRIKCKTEELLLEINDPGVAYKILSERANRC